ncbi:YbdD/YjiX family protein [Microbacterium sp. NPDC089320]|uniref:YbdD/YjiX family protein n=1 Tax=Microbacterium sp. NPDC089320 TaxID=3155182 RepID=UPI003425D60F
MTVAVADAARRVWHAVAWYMNGVTGQSRYEAYVEHERERHPDREPLREREFWRAHYAQQDADPGARCC